MLFIAVNYSVISIILWWRCYNFPRCSLRNWGPGRCGNLLKGHTGKTCSSLSFVFGDTCLKGKRSPRAARGNVEELRGMGGTWVSWGWSCTQVYKVANLIQRAPADLPQLQAEAKSFPSPCPLFSRLVRQRICTDGQCGQVKKAWGSGWLPKSHWSER